MGLDRDHEGMTSAWFGGRCGGLGLFAAALVASAMLAAPARAEFSILHAERTSNGVVLTCNETYECTGTGECDGWQCARVNADLQICIPPDHQLRFEVLCCETVEDCPQRDGVNARSCSTVAGDVSVCVWGGTVPRAYNLCTSGNTAATFESVLACFDVVATGSLSFAQGDCDGDGEINGTDSAVCVPNIIPPPIDGGVNPNEDLGVDDGGTDDGGTVSIDQGPRADTGANPTAPFQGGGGCSAGSGGRSSGVALLAMFGVVVTWRRRRAWA